MAWNTLDLSGQRFGRLTVVARTDRRPGAWWRCVCDCGGEKVTRASLLRNGETQSCGCLQKERTSEASKTHGHAPRGKKGPTYVSWRNALARCNNPLWHAYHLYGGRGITICERWASSFANFLADMGERPPGHTLDRLDPDGNYEPGNCRWATPKQQAQNRRRARHE